MESISNCLRKKKKTCHATHNDFYISLNDIDEDIGGDIVTPQQKQTFFVMLTRSRGPSWQRKDKLKLTYHTTMRKNSTNPNYLIHISNTPKDKVTHNDLEPLIHFIRE